MLESKDGTYIRVIGGKGNANGQFLGPSRICISQDGLKLYVADTSNHRVQVLESDGTHIQTIGVRGNADGQFIFPQGICLSPDGGELYVAHSSVSSLIDFKFHPLPLA